MLKDKVVTYTGNLLRIAFPEKPFPVQVHRLVVLKPCCLGDVVFATAAIAALANRFPQAVIDVAVGSWSRAVLENNPRIRALVDAGRVGQGAYGWRDVRTLAETLRRNGYDAAVTLDRSPVVGIIPWLAGIPHRAGMDSHGRGFAHTVRSAVPDAPRHEADLYLDVVRVLSPDDGTAFWTEFYPPDDVPPIVSDAPFAVLHPAGGVNPGMKMVDKRWPPARFAALADRLAVAGWRVVFSGTADDAPLCTEIVTQMTHSATILAGKLSLGQFGALCRRAALFVGGDTGATHIAVASGCKVVAIFGPTDPRRYGAYAPPSQAETVWRARNVPAGGVGQGAVHHFSWDDGVSVADVFAACTRLLEKSS